MQKSEEHGQAVEAPSVVRGVLKKIYGPYITAERLEVMKRSPGSNLQEPVMTDFSIEDDKDAIKTKPSYPDAGVNKPLHTAQHQADS